MKFLFLTIVLLFTHNLYAQEILPQSPDEQTLKMISEHNQRMATMEPLTANSQRSSQVLPFAEYEKTGYLFFNDDDFRGYAAEIKRTIAQNLPQDVTLIVYSTSTNQNYLNRLKTKYLDYIEESRLIILQIPHSGSNSFWTRDNLPLPVWTDGEFTLVDAKYYYNFEPDAFLTNLFSSLSSSHNYFFEGGNFMANSRGECIVINRRRSYPGGVSDTAAIPDSIFKNHYGCQKLIRFQHLKGIGHADEVIKFINDDVVVTDTPEYVADLEAAGYEVHMMPEGELRFETYINSLQVNDVLFVPSFNESGDQNAVDLYKRLNPNLKIITIPTRNLATGGQGGIHCITMGYPPVPLSQLLQSFKATIVR